MALGVVRDLPSPRSLADPGEAAAYQEHLMAEYVLGQLAHGVADGTIRGDRLVLPVPEGRYRGEICELTGRVVSSPDR